MLGDIAKKYYQEGYNCAEAMLIGSNEYYDLNLNKNTFNTMIGFGGGINIDDLCGAISGGVASIGATLGGDSKPDEKEVVRKITIDFINAFELKKSCIECKQLKSLYRDEHSKCADLVKDTGEILEGLLAEYINKK